MEEYNYVQKSAQTTFSLSLVSAFSHCTIKCLHCALFNENGTPIEISLDEVYLVTLIYLQLELP